MELRNWITILALRSTIRPAWVIAGAPRALGALGKRRDRHARRMQLELLEPLMGDGMA
jgi:hypothetical protein